MYHNIYIRNMYLCIQHSLFLQFQSSAITLAKLARANIAVGTKLDHLGLAASDVHLANLLVEAAINPIVLDADGEKVLLEGSAIPPVGGEFSGKLVVVEMDLLELPGAHGGVALRNCASELC